MGVARRARCGACHRLHAALTRARGARGAGSCDLVTITGFNVDAATLMERKGVVISARVHPGETQASWMMKGVIEFLMGPSLDAKILRDNFVFKIVPVRPPRPPPPSPKAGGRPLGRARRIIR